MPTQTTRDFVKFILGIKEGDSLRISSFSTFTSFSVYHQKGERTCGWNDKQFDKEYDERPYYDFKFIQLTTNYVVDCIAPLLKVRSLSLSAPRYIHYNPPLCVPRSQPIHELDGFDCRTLPRESWELARLDLDPKLKELLYKINAFEYPVVKFDKPRASSPKGERK